MYRGHLCHIHTVRVPYIMSKMYRSNQIRIHKIVVIRLPDLLLLWTDMLFKPDPSRLPQQIQHFLGMKNERLQNEIGSRQIQKINTMPDCLSVCVCRWGHQPEHHLSASDVGELWPADCQQCAGEAAVRRQNPHRPQGTGLHRSVSRPDPGIQAFLLNSHLWILAPYLNWCCELVSRSAGIRIVLITKNYFFFVKSRCQNLSRTIVGFLGTTTVPTYSVLPFCTVSLRGSLAFPIFFLYQL